MEHIAQIIQDKNWELAPQESKQPKSGDVARFSEAIKHHKIVNGDLEELKEALRYAMVKIGLRSQNWPTDEEKGVLISHVLKGYGGHTASEIKLAFDMAIEGKLDVETNCYENFSCLYFSNIMNAYRSWSTQEYKQLPQELPEIEYKEDISDKAMEEWFKDKVRQFELDPNMALVYAPIPIYEWLDKNGRINISGKEKHEYLGKAVNVRQGSLIESVTNDNSIDNRKALSEFNDMKENGCFKGKEIDRLKSIAKQLILKDILLDKDFRL